MNEIQLYSSGRRRWMVYLDAPMFMTNGRTPHSRRSFYSAGRRGVLLGHPTGRCKLDRHQPDFAREGSGAAGVRTREIAAQTLRCRRYLQHRRVRRNSALGQSLPDSLRAPKQNSNRRSRDLLRERASSGLPVLIYKILAQGARANVKEASRNCHFLVTCFCCRAQTITREAQPSRRLREITFLHAQCRS